MKQTTAGLSFQFNVTNAEEFAKGQAKPRLEEVGPYVFDEFHKKVDLVWNDDNGTVTYKQVRSTLNLDE